MKLRLFLLFTTLFAISVASTAFARKPAVEDFVGVETENYKPTTTGTEVMFNFGNHIESHQKRKAKIRASNGFVSLVVVAFFALPFLMWWGITNSLNSIEEENETSFESNESVSSENVKHLSDYHDKQSDDDDIKKAS
jgi:cytoskeletal protein RodZ